MSAGQWWTFGLLAMLLFWTVGAYSRLQRLRSDIHSAFSNLATQVRRRHELSQQLRERLRGVWPAGHDVLERVQAASSQMVAATDLVKGHPNQSGPLHSCAMAEDVFQEAHGSLLEHLQALTPGDDWPDDVPGLLDELSKADNQARFARGLFNEATQRYNDATVQWPTRLVARPSGFQRAAPLPLAPSRSDSPRAP